MSEFSSALELAQAVTEEANRIKQGAKAEQDAARVLNRVDEATVVLGRLSQVVTAAKGLSATSGVEFVGLSGLDDGRSAFERLASNAGWLPSDQAFNGARNKMGEVTKRVTGELAAAWTLWTSQSIAELRLVRMPVLDVEDRKPAQQYLKDMRDLAKKQVPTTGDISMFRLAHAGLAELLGRVPDPEGELVPLLERLAVRPIPLADLTDEQIGLLRQVADQIEVRRRGA